jgi:hypothetical protein
VSEADTQEMMKLLDVISVTDSDVSTTGGGWVVSPSEVTPTGQGGNNTLITLQICRREKETGL